MTNSVLRRLTAILVTAVLLPGCSSASSGIGSLVYSANGINPKDVVPTVKANGANAGVKAEVQKKANSTPTCEDTNDNALAKQPLTAGDLADIAKTNSAITQAAVKSAATLYITSKSPSTTTQAPDVSLQNFVDLPGLLNGVNKAGNRTAFYELQYFKGNYIDHFGNSITPSQITEKNQDQEIQNLLTVFLESVFDDIEEYHFDQNSKTVPYWVSADATTSGSFDYYLGGKSMGPIPTFPADQSKTPVDQTSDAGKTSFASLKNLALITSSKNQVPTFIAYAYYRYYEYAASTGKQGTPTLLVQSVPMQTQPDGNGNTCGMTQTKTDVLLYLSRRTGALTGGEAGALLGAIGGANIGPVVILGKISIGDNQTLKSIVQAFLAETAERVALASARENLLRVSVDENTDFSAVLDSLTVQKPASSTSAASGSGAGH